MESVSRKCHADGAGVEPLENRTLMSVSGFPQFGGDHGADQSTVYVESNNPQPGQNAVIAFHRDAASGALRQIGTFPTRGTGFGNATQGLGPDDSDQEVVASPDGRFLFAVNQGSNSVAVFRIRRGGELRHVRTFDSGGVQPVSLGLSGDHLIVANRGDALQGHAATVAPNYTSFNVNEDGSLSPVPGSTVTLPIGLSPAQALISRDGRFLFGDNFAIPGTTPGLAQTLDPFRINNDGTLSAAPGGPVNAAVTPNVLLGAALHPTQRIIYGGLTGANGIAVFTYDRNGSVKFVTSVADQGAAPCWITVSADGKYLYAANTGTDSIGVFSLADPLHPVQVQEFKLAGPYSNPGVTDRQTASFQIALDPSGTSLYVVNQDTASTRDFQQGNAVHALSVAANGTLSESNAVTTFSPSDVPAAARLQGVAVVATRSRDDDDGGKSHGRDRGDEFSSDFALPSGAVFSTTRIDDGTADASSSVVDLASGRSHRP